MANQPEDDTRLANRRGVEHIPIKGAAEEELGEIVPSPVVTQRDLDGSRGEPED